MVRNLNRFCLCLLTMILVLMVKMSGAMAVKLPNISTNSLFSVLKAEFQAHRSGLCPRNLNRQR